MWLILLLALFYKTEAESNDYVKCGQPQRSFKWSARNRIVGGWEAVPHSIPWQVRLELFHNSYRDGYCGGSLVRLTPGNATSFVLTAAHCLVRNVGSGEMRSPNDIEVSLGVHFPELRPTLVSAVSGYTIRNYNLETKEEDIALVQLRKTITFTDTVMPVCLPQSNDPVPTNARCYISGWGKTIISGDLSPTLRVVDVKILGNSNCEVHEKAKPKSFCAGHKEGGKDACQGDSGGPLMCFVNNHFVLYGITSHGTGCGFPGKAGVYSEVAKYMDWIREQSTSYGIAFDPYTE